MTLVAVYRKMSAEFVISTRKYDSALAEKTGWILPYGALTRPILYLGGAQSGSCHPPAVVTR